MYVIVDNRDGKQYKKPGHVCPMQYDTQSGAKGAATRLNKSYATVRFLVMTAEQYHYYYPTKMVKRVNLMSGKEFMEAEDTPNFCSPASESYWSM